MFKNWLIIIAVAMFLFNCAPAICINKEYTGTSFNGRKLNIVMMDSIGISYEGSMDNEFPLQNRNDSIKQFIGRAVVKAAKDSSVFEEIKLTKLNCDSLHIENLQWRGTDTFSVSVPLSRCVDISDTNSILLLLENTSVESHPWVQIIMVGLVPVGALPHKPLSISSKFVYWDPVRGKPVAWGFSKGAYDQGPAVTLANWKYAARSHGLSAIRKTPFVLKSK